MFYIFSKRSSNWFEIRKSFLKKYNTCSACGRKKRLQVHHIEPVHVSPDKELDITNLITLCSNCHFVFGHLMDYKSWNIDVRKDSEIYLNKIINKPKLIKAQNISSNYMFWIINQIKKYVKK